MGELFTKLKAQEIQKQAAEKADEAKSTRLTSKFNNDLVWGKKAKQALGKPSKVEQESSDKDSDEEEERRLMEELKRIKAKKALKKRGAMAEHLYQEPAEPKAHKWSDPRVDKLKQIEERMKRKEVNIEEHNPQDSNTYRELDSQTLQLRTAQQLLMSESCDPESTKTIVLYFINLLSFIFTLLIFYGLVIIMMVASGIHIYDWTYNYEQMMIDAAHSPSSDDNPYMSHVEFKSNQEMEF